MMPSWFAALALLAIQDPAPGEIRAYLARLAERGLHAEVVREGETFLRAHKDSAEADVARYRMGCSLLALGRDRTALEMLEPLAANEKFEFAAESGVRAAEAALRAGDAQRADALLGRALSKARGATRESALLLRARTRLTLGRHADASADAQAARDGATAPERKREAALLGAWCDLRGGNAAAAESTARTLVADREADADEKAEARVLLGEARLDLGQTQAALEAFRAVEAGAWSGAAQRGAGFASAALGDHAAAARAFEAALKAEPEGPQASECALHLGIERLAAGDAAGARAALDAPLLDADPDAPEWRARAALAAGDAASALAALDRVGKASRGDAQRAERLSRLRGEALEKSGRTAEAARAYADGGSPAARLEAARASLAAGDAASAAQHARALIDAAPAPELAAQGWIALGEASFAQERWPDARAAFDRAADLDTDAGRGARARLRAAWSAWQAGDAAGAAARADAASRGLTSTDEQEEARFLAARALESAGDAGAAAAWRRYLERHAGAPRATDAVLRLSRLSQPDEARPLLASELKNGGTPEVAFELGELEAKARNHAAARAAYERALTAPSPAFESAARYGLAFACAALGDVPAAEKSLAPLVARSDLGPELAAATHELAANLRVRAGDPTGALAAWSKLAAAKVPAARQLASLRPIVPLLVRANRSAEAESALAALAKGARGADLVGIELERAWLALESRGPDGPASGEEAKKSLGAARRALDRAAAAGGDAAALSEARLALGEGLAEAGDSSGACTQLAAAAQAGSPVVDRVLVRLAWERLATGATEEALRDLERFEKECAPSRERPRALALRGEALARLDRQPECAQVLMEARALVREPALRELVLERLGTALTKTERWREAADVLAEYLREFPKGAAVATAQLERGRALAQLGDERGARAAFERALAGGGVVAARARLERAQMARAAGDRETALSEALKAALLTDDPESSPQALWLASELLEEQGEADAARARLREIVERYPRTPLGARAKAALGATPGTRPKAASGTPAPKNPRERGGT